MRLGANELCPIHKSVSCCGRESLPRPRLIRLGVQRVEDPHHPRGYRELRSPGRNAEIDEPENSRTGRDLEERTSPRDRYLLVHESWPALVCLRVAVRCRDGRNTHSLRPGWNCSGEQSTTAADVFRRRRSKSKKPERQDVSSSRAGVHDPRAGIVPACIRRRLSAKSRYATEKTPPTGTPICMAEFVSAACAFLATMGTSLFCQRIHAPERRRPADESSPRGFLGLWSSLAGRKRNFPVRFLADSKQTLEEFVQGKGRGEG